MSMIAVSTVVRHSESKGSARLVAIALADLADAHGRGIVMHRAIRDRARLGPAGARLGLARLAALGEVTFEAAEIGTRSRLMFQLTIGDLG